MKSNKIVPCLWFHTNNGGIRTVVDYYSAIFADNFHAGLVLPLGDTPDGNAEMCAVQIFGQHYNFMSTANEHHTFNDALALAINCAGQEEIDKYWDYFTAAGRQVQCGWCIDAFGLRWQVLPDNLGELMSLPNSFEIMMKQKKIIIAEYLPR